RDPPRPPPAVRGARRGPLDVATLPRPPGRRRRSGRGGRRLLPRGARSARALLADLRRGHRLVDRDGWHAGRAQPAHSNWRDRRRAPRGGGSMTHAFLSLLAAETKKLEQAGLYKPEVIFPSPIDKSASRPTAGRIDFTSDDYLGFGADRSVLESAETALGRDGVGTGSPRVFRGTRAVHKDLE